MLIEINYQVPTANSNGYVVAQRLIREDDIIAIDPKPDDSTKTVVRIKGSGSQFVQSFTDLTVHESYSAFKSRYANASASTRMVQAEAVQTQEVQTQSVKANPMDCGGC